MCVLTEALVLSRAGGEAVIALASVAAPGVEAAPVLADAGLGLTLILICGVSWQEQTQEQSSYPSAQGWSLSFLNFVRE